MRPFQNIIGDPEHKYVADGMVDDIITALSRFATAYANVSDAPLRSQEVIRRCIRTFPGIRRADRKTRAELGAAALEKAMLDPRLVMDIEREVRLPPDDL